MPYLRIINVFAYTQPELSPTPIQPPFPRWRVTMMSIQVVSLLKSADWHIAESCFFFKSFCELEGSSPCWRSVSESFCETSQTSSVLTPTDWCTVDGRVSLVIPRHNTACFSVEVGRSLYCRRSVSSLFRETIQIVAALKSAECGRRVSPPFCDTAHTVWRQRWQIVSVKYRLSESSCRIAQTVSVSTLANG